MDRMNFRPNEFLRWSWVSKAAQEYWAPAISGLTNFLHLMEREAVKIGIKPAIIQTCSPDELPDLTANWVNAGLSVFVLDRIADTRTYQSSTPKLRPGDPWLYRIVIGQRSAAEAILYAHRVMDSTKEGVFLGYPACCINFFQKYWVDEKWIDTTLPMAQDWRGKFVHPANNILLRWAGIRLVSHLPCSLTCRATRSIGDANVQLAIELGFKEQIDKVIEMLSWPVEWSSLHGIATITTPVFRIVTSSDALPTERKVQLYGERYPVHSASGNKFPFRNTRMWTDNGFSSMEAMEQAHNKLIDFVKPLFPRSIIDFGCGNSRLLHIMARLFGARVDGVDLDPDKNPTLCSDIFDVRLGDAYDLALISVARFKETSPERCNAWLEDLRASVKYLLVYSYEDGPWQFSIPESWTNEVRIIKSTEGMVLLELNHDSERKAIFVCQPSSSIN